jgi:hypothetical protein
MEDFKKQRHTLLMVRDLVSDPRWKFFREHLESEVENLLMDLEGVVQDKNAYIILGRIKSLRNILHLNSNAINILLNSTPEGPVGE